MRKQALLSGFLHSNIGKLWLKIVGIQIVPPFHTDKTMEKVHKISNKNQKHTISIIVRLNLSYGTNQ
jgi:hypothetical protein